MLESHREFLPISFLVTHEGGARIRTGDRLTLHQGSRTPPLRWIASFGSRYRHAPRGRGPRIVSLILEGSGVRILQMGYTLGP